MSRAWSHNVRQGFDLTVLQLCNTWRLKVTKSGIRDCMAVTCAVPAASVDKTCNTLVEQKQKADSSPFFPPSCIT